MNASLTPATRLSRILTDWLRPNALVDRDLSDLDLNLASSRPGINVPSVNIRESANAFVLEIAAPGLQRQDFQLEVDDHTLGSRVAGRQRRAPLPAQGDDLEQVRLHVPVQSRLEVGSQAVLIRAPPSLPT